MITRALLVALGAAGLSDPTLWSATLSARDGSRVSATARVESAGVDALQLSIDVRGAPARSAIAWAVHQGGCEALGPVHGNPGDYPPLVTDFTGETWETALVARAFAADGQYAVVIRKSGDPSSRVAACGALKAATP